MKFYCTGGRGTETFIVDELRNVIGEDLLDVSGTDGKVFFQVKDTAVSVYTKLLSIKSAERCLVQLVHTPTLKLGKRDLLTQVHKALGDRDIWRQYKDTVYHMKHNTSLSPEIANGEPAISDSSKCSAHSVKMAFCDTSHDIDIDVTVSSGLEDETLSQTEASDLSSTSASLNLNLTGNDKCGINIDSQDGRPAIAISTDTLNDPTSNKENSSVHRTVSKRKHSSQGSEDETVVKKSQFEREGSQNFRVSCRFTGRVRRKLETQRTAQQLGAVISHVTGWKVELRNPDIEICVHMNDTLLTAGMPISRDPLSKRSYMLHSGLRSTLAWIMAHLSNIQPGDVVLDPMCGKGTILIELAHMYKGIMCVGMDKDPAQLQVAMGNLTHARLGAQIHLARGDTTKLPLPADSVDQILTDAPFGQNHLPDLDLHTFYTSMLNQLSRVLRPGGTMVLLTSSELMKHIPCWISCCHGNHNSAGPDMDGGKICCPGNQNVGSDTDEGKMLLTAVKNHCDMNVDGCRDYDNTQSDSAKVDESNHTGGHLKSTDSDHIQSKLANTCQCDACIKIVTNPIPFKLHMSHYVKLGETDGAICVLENKK